MKHNKDISSIKLYTWIDNERFMKYEEYEALPRWRNIKGTALVPANSYAEELLNSTRYNDILLFKNLTPRDLSLHRCYFAFLNLSYGYMPSNFKSEIHQKHFYNWLKVMQDQYDVIFKFKQGSQAGITLIETKSISFSRMDNNSFKNYVNEQIPVLYDIYLTLYPALADGIIETLEADFKSLFSKL